MVAVIEVDKVVDMEFDMESDREPDTCPHANVISAVVANNSTHIIVAFRRFPDPELMYDV